MTSYSSIDLPDDLPALHEQHDDLCAEIARRKSVRRRGKSKGGDETAELREARAEAARVALRDRRRFKANAPSSGTASRLAPADSTGTIFPNRIKTPDRSAPVLKDGAHNAKIGGDVLVGRLKSARIFTLTLEERATCPKSCALWRECYGNNMQHSIRWRAGSRLETALRREVADLCATHATVLIRLHVLGDFYSFAYVALWADLLDTHANLHTFGFTARRPDSKIGGAIFRLRDAYPDRFMIRESGRTGRWGSFTITDPFPRKTIGDAVVCPEQRETNLRATKRHCGTCAICWSGDRPVAFIEH